MTSHENQELEEFLRLELFDRWSALFSGFRLVDGLTTLYNIFDVFTDVLQVRFFLLIFIYIARYV